MPHYRIYAPTASPADPTTYSDNAQFVSGLEFYVGTTTTGLWVTDIWVWSNSDRVGETGRTAAIYTVSDRVKVAGDFTFPALVAGWNQVTLPTPYALTAGTRYKAVVFSPSGRYSATGAYWAADVVSGPLTAPSNANSTEGQNTFTHPTTPTTMTYPLETYNSSSYWVDVSVWDGADRVVAAVAATASASGLAPDVQDVPNQAIYVGSTIPYPLPFYIGVGDGPAHATADTTVPVVTGERVIPGAGGTNVTIVAVTEPYSIVVATNPGTKSHLTALDAPSNGWNSSEATSIWEVVVPSPNNTTGADADNNWQITDPSALWSGTDTYL